VFASACATASLEQLEIIFRAKGRDRRVVRPSVDEISHELVRACRLGHSDVVERLLQEKAEVNAAAAGSGGRTALQAAAEGGHIAVVERLLQEKAEVNAAAAAYSRGRTALQAAAGGGHLAVVERLLQEKAKVNAEAVDNGGDTALQAAAGGGHKRVVECLRQAGASDLKG
jgi:ankyrin repeat protein